MTRISTRQELSPYLDSVRDFEPLGREEEGLLAEAFRNGDESAGEKLVASNLKFVVKIANEYRGYQMKLEDLVQEGNLGLLIAVKKFDPARGFRLITYAVWWIRAYIQSYVMRSWSLVKVGTTQAQRKLFFKLRSERSKIEEELGPESSEIDATLADRLGVEKSDVEQMRVRMGEREQTFDAPLYAEGKGSLHDVFFDEESRSVDTLVEENEVKRVLHTKVSELMFHLNEKERYIVRHRLLHDDPMTLQKIGDHFSVSRERARQIESNVMKKIKTKLAETDLESVYAH